MDCKAASVSRAICSQPTWPPRLGETCRCCLLSNNGRAAGRSRPEPRGESLGTAATRPGPWVGPCHQMGRAANGRPGSGDKAPGVQWLAMSPCTSCLSAGGGVASACTLAVRCPPATGEAVCRSGAVAGETEPLFPVLGCGAGGAVAAAAAGAARTQARAGKGTCCKAASLARLAGFRKGQELARELIGAA